MTLYALHLTRLLFKFRCYLACRAYVTIFRLIIFHSDHDHSTGLNELNSARAIAAKEESHARGANNESGLVIFRDRLDGCL